MHTPTKAQMQVVIDNLKEVLPRAMHENALNMAEGSVNNGVTHKCGTTHCFAGWYAVAVFDNSLELVYHDGIDVIDSDLGFSELESLKIWAFHNEKLWGNDSGVCVFCERSAFYHPDKRPDGAQNLQHIIDHLEEVRDRLPL